MNARYATWLLAAIAVATLSGCSAVQHDCPLGEECVGLKDTYQAASTGEGNHETVLPKAGGTRADMEDAREEAAASDTQVIERGWVPFRESEAAHGPVYRPPEPVRIWLAPWQGTEDNYLRGEQYLYATRPGEWNFGDLRAPGALGDLLGPAIPTSSGGGPVTRSDRVQPHTNLMDSVSGD